MTTNQSENGKPSDSHYLATRSRSVPRRLILGPGPSSASPRVLRAMSQPIIGYLDPAYFEILADVQSMLAKVFITKQTTMAVAGAGSAGMEAGLSSLLERGDKAIICVNGFFCERQILMCERLGVEVVRVDAPYGKTVDPQLLEDALKTNPDTKLVSAIHAETSAGVLQDIGILSGLAHDHGALFMTDVVTSLAGTPFEFDAWEIDYAYGGSQKCFAAPPGISPVAISDRSLEHIRNRKTLPSSWYLDLNLIADYWGPDHVHHHTSPVSMIYGLREALVLVHEEGLETRWMRHEKVAQALRAGLEALHLDSPVSPEHRLNQLTVVSLPEGVDDGELRSALLNEYSIEVGRGLGQFAGKVIRVGLMGESCVPANVFALLSALERILPRLGYEVPRGEAVAAASKTLAEDPSPVAVI
ncbi:MAG: alanine--glyoxylate aminotransferase family protein [Chloroflexi bacterium]|nr:alanine--glyoxylate aminotransferase family protein [Chloroflexota bacterium]